MGKKRLTLSVEAEKLYQLTDPTETDILNHCALSDDSGNKATRGEIKTDKFGVSIGNDVRWEGISVADIDSQSIIADDVFAIENDYSVSIDYVIYFPVGGEKNFFENVILQGIGNPEAKKVTAKVKSSGLNQEDLYTYLIIFTIYPPRKFAYDPNWNSSPKSFGIDPKLEIPPKG